LFGGIDEQVKLAVLGVLATQNRAKAPGLGRPRRHIPVSKKYPSTSAAYRLSSAMSPPDNLGEVRVHWSTAKFIASIGFRARRVALTRSMRLVLQAARG
jgi:hypothetical protein